MRKQVRKNTAISSIEPLVHLNTGIGNSSASFSPATGNRVVTVGYGIGCGTPGTEKLRLYDTSDENLTKHSGKKYLAPYKKISHANSTSKLVIGTQGLMISFSLVLTTDIQE